jgi:MscS family membrane protein
MITIKRRRYPLAFAFILLLAFCLSPVHSPAQSTAMQAASKPAEEGEAAAAPEMAEAPTVVSPDELNRGTPRTALEGFITAAGDGNYDRAAEYLDLRNLPAWLAESEGPKFARQLKIVLDRTLLIDFDMVSTSPAGNVQDGLPPNREVVDRIKTPAKTVDVMLQRVPREDGVLIWKISNRTVIEIPHLYDHFGYRPFEEALSKFFPDVVFLGWHTWQWVAIVTFIPLGYLGALLPTWLVGLMLQRKETEMSRRMAQFIAGPVRIILWLMLVKVGIHIIGPTVTIRSLMKAGTVMTVAFAWATIRGVALIFDWWADRLTNAGQESATVLLQPAKRISQIAIALLAALVWLDNIGFNVGTILAGLGVGGLAVALALQDTIKNFIGSIMILVDRPYQVGQRIVVKGHDGVVEDVGLRSTKMRLLTGHQTTIPNHEMASVDIENIGRRPHIRRLTNIAIPYDTPREKVEKAVEIIEAILDNHEGMDPDFPPRVYFNEFNRDSLNIIVLYWYHPADYWAFLALNQRVNTQIMREFENEGIKFALPTTTTYLSQDDEQPLDISISKEPQMTDPGSG